MDPDKTLVALFTKLRAIWSTEYGTSVVVRATALDMVLRVRGLRDTGGDRPTFLLTVRPTGDGFRVRYRPSGKAAPDPETRLVGFDQPAVLKVLFRTVMEYIDGERKRLFDYRGNI
jgi:hypothetical protein